MKNENPLPFLAVILIIIGLAIGGSIYQTSIQESPNYFDVIDSALDHALALVCAWFFVKCIRP